MVLLGQVRQAARSRSQPLAATRAAAPRCRPGLQVEMLRLIAILVDILSALSLIAV